MKVKIGDTIYDSEKEPVMVILSTEEKELIANMSSDNAKFCSYPPTEEWTKDNYTKIQEWMKT